jgi:hypothetical protein
MAFDKEEIKQLDRLFEKQDKRTNEKFEKFANAIDKKTDDKFEKFAVIINDSFSKTQRMIENMNAKIDSLDKRLDKLEKEFKDFRIKTEDRFMSLDGNVNYLIREVTKIRKSLEGKVTQEQCDELEDRVTVLESKAGIKY